MESTINSPYDDYAPVWFQSNLYFLSNRPLTKVDDLAISAIDSSSLGTSLSSAQASTTTERLYRSSRSSSSMGIASLADNLPINAYQGGSVAFAVLEDSTPIAVFPRQVVEMRQGKRVIHVDLSSSVQSKNGQWSAPVSLASLNSSSWESQPALSGDGRLLVFASDREFPSLAMSGGTQQQRRPKNMDLYYSLRTDFSWSAPMPLSSDVNTDGDDITPWIGNDGMLYYASKDITSSDFDIYRTDILLDNGTLRCGKRQRLAAPYNSREDDISPMIVSDSLFVSSKRKGGCGGYDIYAFEMCGPVYLRGRVLTSSASTPSSSINPKGILEVVDTEGTSLTIPVGTDGKFTARVQPRMAYTLRYENDCIPKETRLKIEVPCNEERTVVMNAKIAAPSIETSFSLDSYSIPFFSTGYYIPNTTEELNALRLRFTYNLLGIADSTRYIRLPGGEYDSIATRVDNAIEQTRKFIESMLEYRANGCLLTKSRIIVFINGYADNQSLPGVARYAGETISDESTGVYIERGSPMNNAILSQLRAYYTYKILQSLLEKTAIFRAWKKSIVWSVQGNASVGSVDEIENVSRHVSIVVRAE